MVLGARGERYRACKPGTTYHFRTKSVDSAGNVGSMHDLTFTTTAMSGVQPVRIGCAGWNIPRDSAAEFPVDGTHLARYLTCSQLRRDQFVVLPRA